MALPTITAEAALTTDPGAAPAWTDLSDYLEDFIVHRGRDQELSRFGAGTATLVLANEDRRFDPTHAAGPYYGNVLPMRRIRIRATFAAVTYDIFNGYADGWGQSYAPPAVATCTLTATDAFKVLAGIDLAVASYPAGQSSGDRIHDILDAAGWPAADRDIDTGAAVLQAADVSGSALAALQKIEETEQGRLYVTAGGLVRFVGRDSLLTAPYTVAQANFGDTPPELEYADLKWRYDDQTIVNEANVTRAGGATQTVSDAASQTRFLRRSRTIGGLLHESDLASADLANWIVSHYSEPVMRATGMRLEPSVSASLGTSHYPQVLGRELGDRVNVKRRPQGVGSAIDQDALIEGITHQGHGTQIWDTDWNLSPADAQIYWALGVAGQSELGTTTRLSY
jgi:hypothetical protein